MNAVDYTPFEGICFTDTFQLNKSTSDTMIDSINRDRLRQHAKTPITVIIGNPPYSIHAANTSQSKDIKYEDLDSNIRKYYIKDSSTSNIKSMYDSYIRAFRWATDKIGENNGIIGFVSNGAWIKSISNSSLRKCLEEEFSKIYIFDLRGDLRTTGIKFQKEGRNVFDDGSRTPISITIFVKQKNYNGRAKIFYSDIGDYLKTREKLEKIKNAQSFLADSMPALNLLKIRKPGNWLISESDSFKDFVPLAHSKTSTYDPLTKSVFTIFTLGVSTSRDMWVYGYSNFILESKLNTTIDYYNEQRALGSLLPNPTKITWTRELVRLHKGNKKMTFDNNLIQRAYYRPFNKVLLYYSRQLIECPRCFNNIFPCNNYDKNLIIAISGHASKNDFSVLMFDNIIDFQNLSNTRCFPLYFYDDTMIRGGYKISPDLLSDNQSYSQNRRDGISDSFLRQVEFKYGNKFDKEDLFYYIYALLHSKDYRKTFVDDLKLSLPKIPLVNSMNDFSAFVKAGRDLAYLHLNYENIPHLNYIDVVGNLENLEVSKMTFLDKNKKDVILYNNDIRIENVPIIAYKYMLNGKSAIEHVMDQYQIKTDKINCLTNNPNDWCDYVKNPKYLLNLILSVISVSVKTIEIVEALPKLDQ
jgi:predicted helicase